MYLTWAGAAAAIQQPASAASARVPRLRCGLAYPNAPCLVARTLARLVKAQSDHEILLMNSAAASAFVWIIGQITDNPESEVYNSEEFSCPCASRESAASRGRYMGWI